MDLFAQDVVRKLSDKHFITDSKCKIELKDYRKNHMMILFYNDEMQDKNTKNVLEVWLEVAKKVVGPTFAVVNLSESLEIRKAFAKMNIKAGDTKWLALKNVPFILIYYEGKPITFYNGAMSVKAIIDYSLILSCRFE